MPAFTSTLPEATPRLIDDRGAELERCLDLVDACGRHANGKEAAAAEQRHRKAEWLLALEKLNFTDAGRASKGRLNAAPSDAFDSAKMPTPIAGSVERVRGADAARRDDQARRIREAVATECSGAAR